MQTSVYSTSVSLIIRDGILFKIKVWGRSTTCKGPLSWRVVTLVKKKISSAAIVSAEPWPNEVFQVVDSLIHSGARKKVRFQWKMWPWLSLLIKLIGSGQTWTPDWMDRLLSYQVLHLGQFYGIVFLWLHQRKWRELLGKLGPPPLCSIHFLPGWWKLPKGVFSSD